MSPAISPDSFKADPAAEWSRPRWILSVLMLTYSGLHFYKTGVIFALGGRGGDFLANFPAGPVAQWAGRFDLFFRGGLSERWMPPPRWGFGPVFHLVTYPLFWASSLEGAYKIWLVVNYGFLAAIAWLLTTVVRPRHVSLGYVAAFVFVTLNFYPLYEALIQRNIEIFELLLVVAAMTCYARRHDTTAGVLIGVAVMTKFLPAIFVPYFALKGRWRAVWGAAAVILPTFLAAEWTLGWADNWVVIQLEEGSFLRTQLNQAVSGLVLRSLDVAGLSAYGALVSRAVVAALAASLALFMWLIRRGDEWRLEWSLLLVAMIMLPPHNQNYYLVFLLIPYLVLLEWLFDGRLDRGSIALAIVSFLLTAWPLPLSLVERVSGPGIGERMLGWSLPALGALLLVAVLVAKLQNSAAASRATQAH